MKRSTLGSLVAVAFAAAACSPQIIYMKQKEVDRTVPPPAASAYQTFHYQQPYNGVDVLFVSDNKDTAQNWAALPLGASALENHYEAFIARLRSDASARSLDYRVQLVTTPAQQESGSVVSPTNGPGQQQSDLFVSTPPSNSIFAPGALETGVIDPVAATLAALARPEFSGRAHFPLFVVYLLGADAGSGASGMQNLAAVLNATTNRGLYQTVITTITNQSLGTSGNCQDTLPAPQFIQSVQAVTWVNPVTQIDLCGPTWANLESTLFSSITAFTSKLILNQVAYLPQLMTVKTNTRTFIWGSDYTWNESGNEIIFPSNVDLKPGDEIDVNYYLTPTDGSPDPGTSLPIVPSPPGGQ